MRILDITRESRYWLCKNVAIFVHKPPQISIARSKLASGLLNAYDTSGRIERL
jgi:hypothetical protein